jgi:DNA-binding beta-propeller fold protein YncE
MNNNYNSTDFYDANSPIGDTIKVGESPQTLEYNPSNNHVYVANVFSSDVSVIGPIDYHFNKYSQLIELLDNIVLNPFGVTNSIDSANKLSDVLTGDNVDNDRTAAIY